MRRHIRLPEWEAQRIAGLLDMAADWLVCSQADPDADLTRFLNPITAPKATPGDFADALADAAAELRRRRANRIAGDTR